MTMRVLLATDGSDHARRATTLLRAFPLPPSAEILVLSVARIPFAPPVPSTIRELEDAAIADARRIAEDARSALASRWPSVEARAMAGDPRTKILEVAEGWPASLVVVGARGLGAVKSALLGSVSTAVVHHAKCPVLVVKESAAALDEILVAVDGSPDGIEAARFVAALPLPPTSRIRLLAAIEPPYAPRTAPGFIKPTLRAAINEMVAERRTEMETMLARVEERFRDTAPVIRRLVVVGHPADEVVSAANQPGVGLVVVGARGLGAVKRLVLGSVSERVLHHAECPVLIVRPGS
ncbi:MAG: universal stress protein [Candidatus Rokubacteria bacterium]|nr:universal stress protein [Candidatus Rokubacteria bacterium]